MTDLKTAEPLLKALKKAATRPPSAEELRKQRVSFIMGAVAETSRVTRADVEQILDAHEGRKVP